MPETKQEPSPEIVEFSSRLRSERKRLNLSQTKFAKACGVSPPSQFLYEKAERSPNADYLALASEIGVDIEYLFSCEHQLLVSLFLECDHLSRDQNGRLDPLESRAELFKDLLESRSKNLEE